MNERKIIDPDPDREVEQMVNPNTAYRRRLAEEKAMENQSVFPRTATQALEWQVQKQKLRRILGALGRCGVGLVFIGGMNHGLMDPVFAVVMALICVVWGLGSLKRNCYV